MNRNSSQPPTDAQIDRLLLDLAGSGRLSHNHQGTLVAYIRSMREKVSQHDQYIIPKDRTPGNVSETQGLPDQNFTEG